MPKPQEFSKCRLCCRTHSLRYCRAFLAMTPDERYESARVHRYCINCLATSHVTGACDSSGSCHRCGLAHHTLLHRSASTPTERTQKTERKSNDKRKPNRQRTQTSREQGNATQSARRPTGRAVKKAAQQPRPVPAFQRRIRGLFNQAWETLEQLQDLVQVSSPQARRHVEDMGPNLIEF
ncbi:uncharacterized protein LOC118755808 [Rhagoletis pomonella]|uniref:uncharacterized protein LOC118755808 n=1 Tax=Rhagoletis pomonella TaxID=28610 RepID=UPI00177D1413|nr:uncharacterized protein LOC118755808 [Rhagoletis pomonella]